jgi:aspartate carbamoyltransferase catalytic subunit
MKLVDPGADTSLRKSSGSVSQETPGNTWRHRNILDIDDFSVAEIDLVMETTGAMVEILSREIKKVPILHGRTIVNLFYEPSTRTRSSFELAAKNLSADVINIDTSKSSVVKGESLINNLNTIKALGAEVVVMRHSMAGAPYLAAQHVNTSIINAGDGAHAHPSQALLDLYTMRQHIGDVKGRKIVIIGDIMHSRVARSNIWCLTKAGALITLCAPPTLMSIGMEEFLKGNNLTNVVIESNTELAVSGADVIMPLRLQLERQQSGLLPTLREYIKYYQLDSKKLSLAKSGAMVMHPGPMNEDIEISSEVAHCAQSVIDEQVTNGIAVRMSLFYLVTGGKANRGI